MVAQGRSDFYVVLTMSLCVLESKQTLMGTQNLGTYMRLTCEYELHILSDTKVSPAKDHGEKYMKLRPLLTRHVLRNRLLASCCGLKL